MALDAVKNFAKVAVSAGYDASATSVVLASGVGALLPAPATDGAFNLVWWNSSDYPDPADDPNVEIVRCTARTTDTLTVTRAQEGTSAATHNTGGKTYKMLLGVTAKMVTDIQTALSASLLASALSTDTAMGGGSPSDALVPSQKAVGTYLTNQTGMYASFANPMNYHAAGNGNTTTGTISSGTNSLVVASASGWSVGMGIAVANAGTGGNTELVTYIDTIVGTTFTLHGNAVTTATAQAVYHDDTCALNAALTASQNVFVPAGTYNITSALLMNNGQVLRGAGRGAVTIAMRGTTKTFHGIYVTSSYCFVQELSVGGPSVNYFTGGSAICVGDGSTQIYHCKFENLGFYHTYCAFKLQSSLNNKFFNLIGSNFTYAGVWLYQLSGSGGNHFQMITMSPNSGNALYGILIDGAEVDSWENLNFTGFKYNLRITGAFRFVTAQSFTDAHFENCTTSGGYSVAITKESSGIVQGFDFHGGDTGNGSTYGVVVGNGVKGVMLDGVNLLNNSGVGKGVLMQGQNCSISCCDIYGHATDGIYLDSTAAYISIVGNNIHDNTTTGINFHASATYVTITANNFSGNGAAMTATPPATFIVSGNVGLADTPADKVPSGGASGQALVKNSATSYDVGWASTGKVPLTDVASGTQAAAVNNAYIADYATVCTVTLPATAALGDVVQVVGRGVGGWRVAPNTGQLIYSGAGSVSATGGYVASGTRRDSATFVCTVANTCWCMTAAVGSPVLTKQTYIMYDTFAQEAAATLLSAHPDETGESWSTANASVAAISAAGRVYLSSGGEGNMVNSATPGSADYTVHGEYYTVSQFQNSCCGLAARASTSANTYYFVRYVDDTTGVVYLHKIVAGSSSQLGTYSMTRWGVGSSHTLDLIVAGTTISAKVDGTSRISVTDSGIAAAGKAGLYFNGGSATTGHHVTKFYAS